MAVWRWGLLLGAWLFGLAACAEPTPLPVVTVTVVTATATNAPPPPPTQRPAATATPPPTPRLQPTATPLPTATQPPSARWLYALAVPFATVRDGVTAAELTAAWRGEWDGLGHLILTQEAAIALTDVLGEPQNVQFVAQAELTAALWAARPAWTITAFHLLEPRLKVLAVDGLSPIAPSFEPANYPLQVEVAAAESNYERSRMTFVAMSGPSGFGRAVADRIEKNGYGYPAEHIAPIYGAADFAHFSNEMPFAPDCPASELEPTGDTIFCVPDRYLAVMRELGVNINEMTGNHVNDWGTENLLHTLELYAAAGILTYGGGLDAAEAAEPLRLEHNGNKIAFVGCNDWGPPRAWATAERPGALKCGDYAAIEATIAELAAEGYLVIATLQYVEYYRYSPGGNQARDFGRLAAAGAAAVSGSQGHHAQGFAFQAGAFIHYGLGNIVFDQMDLLGTRQGFIDTYLIYEGRLLHVDLWTGLIEDYCCPRPMTAEERAALLEAVFEGSGWGEASE